jgi:ABC-type transport system involved in multi-copper enzyme maturation permease subunit
MIGAVCHLELLHLHRRGRQRLFCMIYGGWLLAEFGFMYLTYVLRSSSAQPIGRIEAASDFMNNFVELFIVQQYILLLLVTPALVAGTITDEKTRGTLQHLLTTALTSPEIILGKLAGQLTRLLELAVLGLPLLCFIGAVGGVDPGVILAVFLSPLLPLLAVASASILASVWCRSTREAVLAVYLVGGLAVLLTWACGVSDQYLDPRYALEPAWQDADWRESMRRWVAISGPWLGFTLLFLFLASWRLRPDFARQMVAQKRRRSLRNRPPVSDLPVYWKARYADDPELSVPFLRWLPDWAGLLVAFGLGWLVPSVAWVALSNSTASHVAGFLLALMGGLLVGVRASGAVTGEREGQTWEPLLLTPLEPRQILRSKVLGARDAVWWSHMLAYGAPTVVMSLKGGLAGVLWMAFWLYGSWVVMYWMGSCGVATSMRSTSSWNSLLTTLLNGYRGILARLLSALPVGCAGACVLNMVLLLVINTLLGTRGLFWRDLGVMVYAVPIYIVAGSTLIGRAEAVLQEAEKLLANDERVMQRHRSPLSPEEREQRRKEMARPGYRIKGYPYPQEMNDV